MIVGIQLQPVDTWFFRDATPFTAQSTPQEQVGSLFPPHPPTVVGSVRAELARLNGWNGAGRWPPELCEVLGNGPDDLGRLSFGGPFLLREEQPLFRAPRHLLGVADASGWCPAALLRPGSPVACDLGDAVRLPELPDTASGIEKLKPGDDVWLTSAGMNAVLGGGLPEAAEVVPSVALWEEEARIGLERERHTRTAKEGMLYSTRHVRPRRGVALGMHVAGVPAEWVRPFDRVMPLGGESRIAACRDWTPELRIDAPVERIRSARRVGLIALSPLDLGEGVRPGMPVVGLGRRPGRVRVPGASASDRRLGLARTPLAAAAIRAAARQHPALRDGRRGALCRGGHLRPRIGADRKAAGVGIRLGGPRRLARGELTAAHARTV